MQRAFVLQNLAFLLCKTKQLERGVATFTQALSIWEQLAQEKEKAGKLRSALC